MAATKPHSAAGNFRRELQRALWLQREAENAFAGSRDEKYCPWQPREGPKRQSSSETTAPVQWQTLDKEAAAQGAAGRRAEERRRFGSSQTLIQAPARKKMPPDRGETVPQSPGAAEPHLDPAMGPPLMPWTVVAHVRPLAAVTASVSCEVHTSDAIARLNASRRKTKRRLNASEQPGAREILNASSTPKARSELTTRMILKLHASKRHAALAVGGTGSTPVQDDSGPTPAAFEDVLQRGIDNAPALAEAVLVPEQSPARARKPRTASQRRRQKIASETPAVQIQQLTGEEEAG